MKSKTSTDVGVMVAGRRVRPLAKTMALQVQSASISMRRFMAIDRLLMTMHEEMQWNAQGDNGADVEQRREKYRRRLERLLIRKTKR